MRVWFPFRFFSCFFVVLQFFCWSPKVFDIWDMISLVVQGLGCSFSCWNSCWGILSPLSPRLVKLMSCRMGLCRIGSFAFCCNFCWDILSPLSPRLVKLMSCRMGLCRIGSFAFCCNFCCCRNPKVLVRHTKHPRRNHYSDEALLAIHTVVAHYHTKEGVLAPAM